MRITDRNGITLAEDFIKINIMVGLVDTKPREIISFFVREDKAEELMNLLYYCVWDGHEAKNQEPASDSYKEYGKLFRN